MENDYTLTKAFINIINVVKAVFLQHLYYDAVVPLPHI